VNYFEHHIGDYDEATSHLSACEDGIYCRLIRKYYATEKPLIGDVAKLQRLVRARNREEREAVVSILEEFFVLESDGWHHHVCDENIAAYLAGEPEREVKAANEKNRLQRHRDERAALFKIVTGVGEHLPWNVPMQDLRAAVKRISNGEPKRLPPLPATAPATPATATQTPNTNTQTPEENTHTAPAGAKPASGFGLNDLVAEGVDRKHGADWLAVRKAKRLPLTSTAWEKTKREADKAGITPAAAVQRCAENGWAGFDASWSSGAAAVDPFEGVH